MSKHETSPMEQAYTDVPKAWYELDYKTHMALTVLSALVLYSANLLYFKIDSLPAHITAASLYALSVVADRYSTVRVIKANSLAHQNGINTQHSEQNILNPDVSSPRKFLLDKRAAIPDVGGTVLAAIYPAIGVGWVVGKTQAAANNLRVAKRINRAVEIKLQNNR